MDNMENEYGETVDVMVGIADMPGLNGKNDFMFDTNAEGEVRLKTQEFGVNTINVFFSEYMGMGKEGTIPTNLQVTKHEMGHANYHIENARSYKKYYNSLNSIQRAMNGHNMGNPSGKRASEWQNKKDL